MNEHKTADPSHHQNPKKTPLSPPMRDLMATIFHMFEEAQARQHGNAIRAGKARARQQRREEERLNRE